MEIIVYNRVAENEWVDRFSRAGDFFFLGQGRGGKTLRIYIITFTDCSHNVPVVLSFEVVLKWFEVINKMKERLGRYGRDGEQSGREGGGWGKRMTYK